jgi:hypothetical protein
MPPDPVQGENREYRISEEYAREVVQQTIREREARLRSFFFWLLLLAIFI